MAISITEPSNQYVPSENISWFEADSTNKDQNSFTYKFKVQVTEVDNAFTTGTTGTTGATGGDVIGIFRVPPRPSTGLGEFSPNSVIKNYVYPRLEFSSATGATAASLTNDGIRKFRILYGEEWVIPGPTGGPTGSFGATGEDFYSWSSAIPDADFPQYNQDNFIIYDNGGTGALLPQLLTDGPKERCILENDNLYSIMNNMIYSQASNTKGTIQIFPKGISIFQAIPIAILPQWTQINNPAPNGVWSQFSSTSIQSSNTIAFAEYSNILTYEGDSGTEFGIGPAYAGDIVDVQINTSLSWTLGGFINDLTLWGKRTSGTWEEIAFFVPFDNGGDIALRITGEVMANDYSLLGFAEKEAGKQKLLITKVWSWTIKTEYPIYWRKVIEGVELPVRYGVIEGNRLAYLNVGTFGVGESNSNYTIDIIQGSGEPLTQAYSFTKDCNNCANCEKVQLTWLNSLGGYDSYSFNCLSAKVLNVDRVTARSYLGRGYTKGDRGRSNPNNLGTQVKQVNTNWTTQDQLDWLESLMMSPDVYEVHNDDGTFIPVTINTTSYSQFVRQDKLKVASFTYTVGYNRKSQTL